MLIVRKAVGKYKQENHGIIHAVHQDWPDHSLIFQFYFSEEKARNNPGNNHEE